LGEVLRRARAAVIDGEIPREKVLAHALTLAGKASRRP